MSRLKNGMEKTFSSLKHKNYRLWFLGQIVSLMGTWVQMTAQGFLIYELTHSMAYLGYIGLASGLPSMVFMLHGGVLADRFSRRNLLIITQTSMMLLAFVLFLLVYLNMVQPWHILFLATLLGISNAFDVPARQAFVFELVPNADLTNAIALNSMMFNLAAIIGPSIAGILYAALGASPCFLINGLSFIAIIWILFILKLPEAPQAQKKSPIIQELKEGVIYCLKNKTIRLFIIILFLTSTIGMSYVTLLPAWASVILKGNAATFGYLQSSRGFGSLIGTLIIASFGNMPHRYRLLYAGTLIFPLFLLFFSLNDDLTYSLLSLAGVGLGMMIVFNSLNSLLQSVTENHIRGRVMSVYSIAFFGGMPLGAFLSGHIAEIVGAKMVIEASGIISLVIAIVFILKSKFLKSPLAEEASK